MEQKPTDRKVGRATWMVLGIMMGLGIGAALHNYPVGVVIGIALGVGMAGPPHKKDTSSGGGGAG